MKVFGFLSGSVRTKVMVPFVVIVLGTVAVLTVVNVRDSRAATEDNAVVTLSAHSSRQAARLLQSMTEYGADTIVLTAVPPTGAIQRALAAPDLVDPVSGDSYTIWTNRLATILNAMATKGFYRQVIYVDSDGLEMVRVDSDGTTAVRVTEGFASHAGSDFFENVRTLSKGEVYLGPMELAAVPGGEDVATVSLATPVFAPDGSFGGAIVANVFAAKLVSGLGVHGGVANLLIDDGGQYLSHPDASRNLGNLTGDNESVVSDYGAPAFETITDGAGDVTVDGRVVAFLPVNFGNLATNNQWTVLAEISESALPSPSLTKPLVIGGILLAIAAAVAFWIGQMVVGPVKTLLARLQEATDEDLAELESGIKAMEAGDLTKEVNPTTADIPNPGSDEVGAASLAVNAMLARLRTTSESYGQARASLSEMITGMQKSSATLLGSANQLDEASRQMAEGTTQITTAINDVTVGSQELSSLAQESSTEVSQVATGSDELASSAQSYASAAESSRDEATQMGTRIAAVAAAADGVAASANDSRSAALEGQKAVQQAVGSMENIASAVDRASGTVNQLGEYGEQIGNIVQTIDEIAAQTNLLALNAAIEAARAGEQGRGFAVVADNVRTLAERSSDATKEIADLVGKVQAGTQEAVVAMEAGVRDVEAGREITSQAGESLASIIESVEASAEQMQSIAGDVQDVAAGAERIVNSTEEMATAAQKSADGAGEMASGTARVSEAIIKVSGVSERTSATTEQVAATTEELSAQAQELSATAVEMKGLADEMEAATGKFRV